MKVKDGNRCFRVVHPHIERFGLGYRLKAIMLDYQHVADIEIDEPIISSELCSVDFERGVAVTKNSVYVWEVGANP